MNKLSPHKDRGFQLEHPKFNLSSQIVPLSNQTIQFPSINITNPNEIQSNYNSKLYINNNNNVNISNSSLSTLVISPTRSTSVSSIASNNSISPFRNSSSQNSNYESSPIHTQINYFSPRSDKYNSRRISSLSFNEVEVGESKIRLNQYLDANVSPKLTNIKSPRSDEVDLWNIENSHKLKRKDINLSPQPPRIYESKNLNSSPRRNNDSNFGFWGKFDSKKRNNLSRKSVPNINQSQSQQYIILSDSKDSISRLCTICNKLIVGTAHHTCEKAIQNSPRNYTINHKKEIQIDSILEQQDSLELFQPIVIGYEKPEPNTKQKIKKRDLTQSINKSQHLSIFLKTPSVSLIQKDTIPNHELNTNIKNKDLLNKSKINYQELNNIATEKDTTKNDLSQNINKSRNLIHPKTPTIKQTRSQYLKSIDVFKPKDYHFQTIDSPIPPKKFIESEQLRFESSQYRARKSLLFKKIDFDSRRSHELQFVSGFPNYKSQFDKIHKSPKLNHLS